MVSGIGQDMESGNVHDHASLFMVEELKVCQTIVGGTDNGCSLLASNHVVQIAKEPSVNAFLTINASSY